jgi:deoxyribodipyrimidine photo-lyase
LSKIAIVWLRRDLRLHDNAALYHALKSPYPVLPLFIFDKNILGKLEDRDDARVTFIHQTLTALDLELQKLNSSLLVQYNSPIEAWTTILQKHQVAEVYTNHDYEPYAIERDAQIKQLLLAQGISFHTFKDQCIFEKNEIVKDDGKPYTVFTPYSKKWKAHLKRLSPQGLSY